MFRHYQLIVTLKFSFTKAFTEKEVLAVVGKELARLLQLVRFHVYLFLVL